MRDLLKLLALGWLLTGGWKTVLTILILGICLIVYLAGGFE